MRLFHKQGADVRVVMTRSAMEFVTPLTFQALSGHSVHTELLDAESENAMDHITLARWAEVILIAPASANSIAKFSMGLADDLLSTLFLASTAPVVIAPAMNQAMWQNTAVQTNINTLQQRGVRILGPAQGEQACGETGPGRMLEPTDICQQLCYCAKKDLPLAGISVLVSAGPTREPIDPVRYISNRSSGKMGYAVAQAALAKGADVLLVSGPVALQAPENIPVISIETAAEMHQAVMEHATHHDIFIAAAAVADFRPQQEVTHKIKKDAIETQLCLQKNPDILATVSTLAIPPFTVGFAAETDDLQHYAQDKLRRKNLDMIAANWVAGEQGGFDRDENALHVYWQDGDTEIAMDHKTKVAEHLLDLIIKRFNEKRTA